MIWKAVMKNGEEVLQSNNGVEVMLKDLDNANVDVFCLIDSLSTLVGLELSNGDFHINNLDLTQLNKLQGGEEIKLVYNSHYQRFRISPESLEFLNSLMLKGEQATYIGFDQSGKFNINGFQFHLGFELDGKLEEFINQPPYTEIIQTNEAYTDFIGSKNNANPYKRIDAVIAYNIGYNKVHKGATVTFKLSLVLRYNVLQKYVSVNALITPNNDINGKLCIFYGDSKSTLDISLNKDETVRLERIITIM